MAIPALDQKVLVPAGHYRHDRHYRVTQPLVMAAVAVLVALPWLNPITLGPSAAMVQWLLSVVAGAGLLCVAAWSGFTGGAMARSAWGRGLAWGWLLAGLLSSLIALLQYTGHSAAWAPWVNLTPAGEAFANLRQRNQFATLTNMALASLCWVVWATKPTASHGRQSALLPWLAVGLAVLLAMAQALLHFSPEPRVIERVVEYASLLGQDDLVAAHMLRYRAAFPEEFAVWSAQNKAVAQALRLPAEVGASVAASGAVSGVGKTP